ncbi:hypothetical protein D1BOALGB6SA_2597 [Olavius sp. associated proteobacterium Delta 1]|nr:hypothetical protein D1BOALGB6SA_2597 [Olavius sp. associated proteobacterium Delta 1]
MDGRIYVNTTRRYLKKTGDLLIFGPEASLVAFRFENGRQMVLMLLSLKT